MLTSQTELLFSNHLAIVKKFISIKPQDVQCTKIEKRAKVNLFALREIKSKSPSYNRPKEKKKTRKSTTLHQFIMQAQAMSAPRISYSSSIILPRSLTNKEEKEKQKKKKKKVWCCANEH